MDLFSIFDNAFSDEYQISQLNCNERYLVYTARSMGQQAHCEANVERCIPNNYSVGRKWVSNAITPLK
jgi:hypothetical protein